MAKRDYYEVLGLQKGASDDEIKKAYRKKAMEMHPDKGGDNELFQELNEANETLSDPEKKARYDQYGHSGGRSNQGFNPFEEFFRRAQGHNFRRPELRGQDMHLNIKLTLEEIFNGVTKKFKYKRNNTCVTCSGKGGTGITQCSGCLGSGVRTQIFQTQFGTQSLTQTCEMCNGNGEMVEVNCEKCAGSGLELTEETVSIDIPSGVLDGMAMNMTGFGHHIKNGKTGDLVIRLMELPHEKFVRNGNDLKFNLRLTYPQLILGDKVEVDTIEGSKIRIEVQEYTKTGAILRIPNKGLKQLQSDKRGDLLLHVELNVPTKVSDEEKELIKAIKKLNENIATEETK